MLWCLWVSRPVPDKKENFATLFQTIILWKIRILLETLREKYLHIIIVKHLFILCMHQVFALYCIWAWLRIQYNPATKNLDFSKLV